MTSIQIREASWYGGLAGGLLVGSITLNSLLASYIASNGPSIMATVPMLVEMVPGLATYAIAIIVVRYILEAVITVLNEWYTRSWKRSPSSASV